jgi:hypothetical protein
MSRTAAMFSGKNGRNLLCLYPSELNPNVSCDENGIGLIEGTEEHFRQLYDILRDNFDFEEDDEEGI